MFTLCAVVSVPRVPMVGLRDMAPQAAWEGLAYEGVPTGYVDEARRSPEGSMAARSTPPNHDRASDRTTLQGVTRAPFPERGAIGLSIAGWQTVDLPDRSGMLGKWRSEESRRNRVTRSDESQPPRR